MQFAHKVSKGSAFNQIYIPRGMEKYFEVGDLVEVRLVEKKIGLHYSKNLPKIGEFKENLIKKVFSFLTRFKEIKQVFVVGSFLTEKVDYRDIDLVLISDDIKIDNKIYDELIEKFNVKFHILAMPEDGFLQLRKICPLTRSMFYYCVSNKRIEHDSERKIDAKHIKFLLMMPEDILEIKTSGRIYYDSLRRVIAIERFLSEKEEDPKKINLEVEKLVGGNLFGALKANEVIEGKALERVREIIKKKLNKIKKEIGNGKDE